MNLKEIVLDIETTGLNYKKGDKIIEICCIELANRSYVNNYFHTYVNPQKEINNAAYNVHKISNEKLKNKPLFSDIAKEFYEFIKNSMLIIHNAKFDLGFINH